MEKSKLTEIKINYNIHVYKIEIYWLHYLSRDTNLCHSISWFSLEDIYISLSNFEQSQLPNILNIKYQGSFCACAADVF